MRTVVGMALLMALGAAIALCGCGGDNEPIVPIAFQGTWMAAAFDEDGELVGVGTFYVNNRGRITTLGSGDVIASGEVERSGEMKVKGSSPDFTFSGHGTLRMNDTGCGVWTEFQNGTEVDRGRFIFWRANGGAFAGIWDVTVNGPVNGNGEVRVNEDGIVKGTIDVEGVTTTIEGIVTGTGTVVVSWIVNDAFFLGNGPANGTVSGSEAHGDWQSDNGATGTWSATKD